MVVERERKRCSQPLTPALSRGEREWKRSRRRPFAWRFYEWRGRPQSSPNAMKSPKWIICAIAFAMMAVSVTVLAQLKARQSLASPGVKVGHIPIRNFAGQVVTNQGVLLPDEVAGFKSEPMPISD